MKTRPCGRVGWLDAADGGWLKKVAEIEEIR